MLDGVMRSNDSHLCHVDVADVILVCDGENAQFGIGIDSTEYSGDNFTKPPIITYLEPGGIAER